MRVRKRMFQRRNSNYQVPEEERLLICLRKRRSFLSFEQCELWGRISRCERERETEVDHTFVGAILRNVMFNFNVKLLEN